MGGKTLMRKYAEGSDLYYKKYKKYKYLQIKN
jgi:hypothetical protein